MTTGPTVRSVDVIASGAAPRPERPRPVRAYLRCACGQLFALPKTQGRPPRRCPFCRSAARGHVASP